MRLIEKADDWIHKQDERLYALEEKIIARVKFIINKIFRNKER